MFIISRHDFKKRRHKYFVDQLSISLVKDIFHRANPLSFREQRSALAAKEKAREAEIASLSKSKVEMMERASQLELLLKATVQNIRVPDQQQPKQQQQTADDEDGNSSEENNEHPDKDDDFEVIDKGMILL